MLPKIQTLTSETWSRYKYPVRVANDASVWEDCKLKYAAISDIHLGHRRTLTGEICDRMDDLLTVDFLKTIDVLFIVGDLFDRLLTFGSQEALRSMGWGSALLERCRDVGCAIRILEGTRSHDYGQSHFFTYLAKLIGDDLDFRYVSQLSIEYMSKHDVNILYVPDNWKTTADEVWTDVNEVLTAHGLKEVDIGMVHMGFEFQLPVIQKDTADSARYQSIVKYAINAGHIHIPNQNKQILVQGSFDRLVHGEEHDKGFMRVGISDKGVCYSFIVNHNAKRYVTVDVVSMSLEDTLEKVRVVTEPLPENSYVRIRAAKTDPISAAMASLAEQYPQFNWSLVDDKEVVGATQDNIMRNIEFKANTSGFSITAKNISSVIRELLQDNTSINMSVIDEIVEECL